jgi:hypothetical protein
VAVVFLVVVVAVVIFRVVDTVVVGLGLLMVIEVLKFIFVEHLRFESDVFIPEVEVRVDENSVEMALRSREVELCVFMFCPEVDVLDRDVFFVLD